MYFLHDSTFTCEECQPGYKFEDGNCVLIQNCEGFKYFSACSECKKGYTFKIFRSAIAYDTCNEVDLELISENCLSISNKFTCDFCKKGYVLNPHDGCEKILFPKCSSTEYFSYKIERFYNAEKYYDYYY